VTIAAAHQQLAQRHAAVLRCCCRACSSCASVMKPSATSASPMRTMGMRACCVDGRVQLVGA
jgi:hypothetical protein